MDAGKVLVLVALAICVPQRDAMAFDPWVDTARYRIEYQIDLSGLGAPWRLWVPTPVSTDAQDVTSIEVEAPVAHTIERDALDNRYIHAEGSRAPGPGARLVARFEVVRRPTDGAPSAKPGSGGPHDPERYLRPQRRIPLDGLIADIGRRASQGLDEDDAKVRAFYEYVVANMRYAKDGTGWGEGDAVWACTSRYGNCTDFHSLFIGMSRSQSIPARFVIGFPIPADREEGTVPGYHCWSEVHDGNGRWRPLDASEAKKSGRTWDYFGFLPSDRVEFTRGRDLVLAPRQDGDLLNYAIYPYAEVDGEPTGNLPFEFRFRRAPARRADLR